ncbi:uncharacterized protein LOC119269972 isoform X2 [Triticum dicoccoides]|uniref:uncharacterized protein LOC119269972 isoform X2 n=1 Tax=Triticum dicoccoides TaxID=85692 RepID=UPI00189014C3|nr:uncharacterized protein LOC119269972 isoform X2 [Triticum dicoccoides]
MPSLYIPASLCAASYPSPCGRAPWLLPAAARDGRRAHYCGSRSNTPLLHRHTSLAASSRETTNYTSSRATSEIDEPDDNGKLESPPTSSTRNRTTAMSRSSTVDLGALLPGVAPLAKPKAPVYHLQLNISCSCPSYKEDDQDKSKIEGKSSTTGTHKRTLVLFSLGRMSGRNKGDEQEEAPTKLSTRSDWPQR